MKLNDSFQQVYVVNLPDRKDRRREMEAQLRRAKLDAKFFAAVRPDEVGDWPSLGAKGCFLSHYRILTEVQQRRGGNALVLEDDLDFAPELRKFESELVSALAKTPWDIVYLGHVENLPQEQGLQLVQWHAPLMTSHFYGVNRRILDRLVAFLQEVQARPAGHPLGGPQHFDGALSMFRAQNPDVQTLLVSPNLGFQRSSRSDINFAWYDKLPMVGSAINTLRALRRKSKTIAA